MNNPPHGPPGYENRERELEEQHRQRAALQQQEELVQREREHNERQERQERERQHREQYQPAPPHQSSTGSIPIHQPVASRLPGAIHSPGGLLANHGGPPPPVPLGAPSGPGNAFGGPLHSEANRPLQHASQNPPSQLQQQQNFGPSILHHNPVSGPGPNPVPFGGPLQQQQAQQQAAQQQAQQAAQQQQEAVQRLQQALPFGVPTGHQIAGAPALGQGGQQPILNDALSYLDQVKVQFADQPDVYNRFLDIMKDFKSQAIDTPGVINRVSELFAGHPMLIQGFNTFLPPGYRIECGAGNDPNTIRVTTPMGTTVQSITGSGRALPDSAMVPGAPPGGGYYGAQRPGNWQQQQQPQHSIESPEAVFSPQGQNQAPPYIQTPSHNSAYEAQQAAAAAHQQQQRGVSQLTSAVATLGHPPRNTQTPTPGQQSMNGGAQPGLEKRGPVEFNHAISYVNKIKNRFQDRPEIYKQFLEILQTYQRESKPIQDVYAQVTTLFNTAPDLLEDFKQFLPESAAQAKAAAAAKAAEEAQQNQISQSHAVRGESKMPPVGNFQVPQNNSKETKKRPRNSGAAPSGTQPNVGGESSRSVPQGPPANKRAKLNHNKPNDTQAVSPTLTPIVPEPLPPSTNSSASQEELAFFDRVKKYIGNKSTMNEFLKLCNMFSQDLIDKNVLVHKVSQFISGNQDLTNWFKTFVQYDGKDQNVENQPMAPSGRVALSNCRGLGPSYRLLPKRERLKPCSGRDEMCKAILNDDWASHPTWASEDSGFVAHRKNVYEDALSRVEEERHDYDFNIEANAKVIQVLEPIAQSILAMNDDQRLQFVMPTGFQGSSQSLYRRVFKKVYGDRGLEVVEDMFRDPCAVLPIVLARLKQKDEEWRFTQREWEKVWQAQTLAIFLKSLDHQGLNVKQADKKNLAAKHLVDVIKTKTEEQRRRKNTSAGKQQKIAFQFVYDISDMDVVLNILRIMVIYVKGATHHNAPERRRIRDFFEKFISIFFGLSYDQVTEATNDVDRDTPEDDSEELAPTELPNGRSKRTNGKKADLRRGVLDRNRNGTKARDDSVANSKESTPESAADDDDAADAAEDQSVSQVSDERWLKRTSIARPDTELDADQAVARDSYKLWANQNIFVFFTIFQTLYKRFRDVKESEAEAVDLAYRASLDKPAKALDYINTRDEPRLEEGETFYSRALVLIEDYIKGDADETTFQGWFRRHFLLKGWQVFTVLDLLKTLAKLGSLCSSLDTKEKTSDLVRQFYVNRQSEETTYNNEINMRKQADKWIKDSELFLIEWNTVKRTAGVRWFQRDDTTWDLDDMTAIDQWKYYVSSYFRIEPTEGVPRERMHKAVLMRNVPNNDADFEDGSSREVRSKEELVMRIAVHGFEIKFGPPPNSEYFIFTDKPFGENQDTHQPYARERLQPFENIRTERFKEKFEMNNAWMKGKSRDEVAQKNDEFKKWMDDGVLASSASALQQSTTMEVDDDTEIL